jgi:hypothetical protein
MQTRQYNTSVFKEAIGSPLSEIVDMKAALTCQVLVGEVAYT